MNARSGTRVARLAAAMVGAALAALPTVGAAPRGQGDRPRAAAAQRAQGADAEDARYYQRALTLRRRILDRAGWAELDTTLCNAGSLRVFPADSAGGAAAADDIAALERIIIVRGVENSLDTPAGHALLRTVIGWEIGATRPVWDVKAGTTPRRAIAPGLVGDVADSETGKCESPLRPDTVSVVVPPAAGFLAPRFEGTTIRMVVGEDGLNRLRDAFFAEHGADRASVLIYTRISLAIVWRDFAVVAVNRRAEERGVVALPSAGGAAYIFHRVGTDWRLLTITRTWG